MSTKFQFISKLFATTQYEVVDSSFKIIQDDDAIRKMLDGSICPAFKEKKKHQQHEFVHRLDTGEGVFYLKRAVGEPRRRVIRHTLKGRRPRSNCGWQFSSIEALRANGFAVMAPIAWAEERWFGYWPRRGMLLVDTVEGDELIDIVEDTTPSLRRSHALRSFGHYLGRLHGAGFYHEVRVQDFILVPDEKEAGEDSYELTMIDADFNGRPPKSEPYSFEKSVISLADAAYLYLRVGNQINRSESRQVLLGYSAGLRAAGQSFEYGTVKRVVELTDKNLLNHRKTPHLFKLFPEAIGSLAEEFARKA